MPALRWTPEDSAEYQHRIAVADAYLVAWVRWARTEGPWKVGYPKRAPFYHLMHRDPEAISVPRETSVDGLDEDMMRVDAVVAVWRIARRGNWKLIRTEYMSHGSSEVKARRLGLTRLAYRQRLDSLRLELMAALDIGASRAT